MELLRRALLLGCIFPALWLFRLATLDPLVSIVRLSPAAQQVQGLRDDPQNVSGQQWDLLARAFDAMEQGLDHEERWRMSADPPEAGIASPWLFYRPDERPVSALLDQIAVGRGTTLVSISGREGSSRYRVDRHVWTRQDFKLGAGFSGKPAPPSTLLFPFQLVAYACLCVGIALFLIIPSATREHGGLSPGELALLAAAVLLFAGPLFAIGGSVQALTKGLSLTLPCWLLAWVAMHFFAKPGVNAPHPLFQPAAAQSEAGVVAAGSLPTFLRWGLAMLAVAIGPLAALVAVSMTFWNR